MGINALSKDEIKNWLKAIGKNRDWLAEQCGITKQAVNDWFSRRGCVPYSKMFIILKLMDDFQSTDAPQECNALSGIKAIALMYTAEEWGKIAALSVKFDISPEEYVKRMSLDLLPDTE